MNLAVLCSERVKCCFESQANNYYRYVVVLSVYGKAGHILTSIVTRWAQLLSMQMSEQASVWGKERYSIEYRMWFLKCLTLWEVSIFLACILTCKHPQQYNYIARACISSERVFSVKAVVCYENGTRQQCCPASWYVCLSVFITLTLSIHQNIWPHESY